MKVGIVGGGQLGMMLGEAAKALGITCVFLDPNPDSPAKRTGDLICAEYDDAGALQKFAQDCDVITYEFENVPLATVASLAQKTPVYPPPLALKHTQDRLAEKALMSSLGVAVPPFVAVSSEGEFRRALGEVGTPSVLKTRRMGYDGKGQVVIGAEAERESAWAALQGQPLILEGYVPFNRELSLIGVRSRDGHISTYPLIENSHKNGILRMSRAPANVTRALIDQANTYITAVMSHLQYVGVMTIELFQADEELIGNEIAPRVHNSGHFTIEGAETSQFAAHLQAICGLPVGPTALKGCSAMLNIIGTMPDVSLVAAIPGVFVHAYGKAPREGRKLGHMTITADDDATLNERVQLVREKLKIGNDEWSAASA